MKHTIRSVENQTLKNPTSVSSEKLSAIFKTLNYIKKDWDLSYERLGSYVRLSKTTTERWLKHNSATPPSENEIELIIHFIAIYKNLNQIFDSKENQISWLNSEHPALNNKKPIDLISDSIEGLILTRRYLDYSKGRGA